MRIRIFATEQQKVYLFAASLQNRCTFLNPSICKSLNLRNKIRVKPHFDTLGVVRK
jgi:hypothetical protein